MERVSTVSIRALAVAAVAYSVYTAATQPLGIQEAILWDHLIRPPLSDAYRAPDAWLGLGYAVLAKRAIGLFRLSEFSLRLPAVLSGIVCAWLVWRRPRLIHTVIFVAAAAAGWFSTAGGYGVALAFSGLGWFGPAIAASPVFVVALLFFFRIKDIQRVVIPSVTIAFILLILPISHGAMPGPQPRIGSREAASFRAAVQTLRGRGPLSVGADPEVLALLQFYRARYRQRDWTVLIQRGQGWWFSATGTLKQIQ